MLTRQLLVASLASTQDFDSSEPQAAHGVHGFPMEQTTTVNDIREDLAFRWMVGRVAVYTRNAQMFPKSLCFADTHASRHGFGPGVRGSAPRVE